MTNNCHTIGCWIIVIDELEMLYNYRLLTHGEKLGFKLALKNSVKGRAQVRAKRDRERGMQPEPLNSQRKGAG